MAEFKTYRKTATIRARQFTGNNLSDFPCICTGECRGPMLMGECAPHIHTLEGDHSVSVNDWIAEGVSGEHWPIKPDIFAKTYVEGTKVVVLSGSSRFVDVMAVCAWLLERDEGAIAMGLHLLPSWYPNCPDHHLAEHEGVAPSMDELHLRKIDLCDEVFVVNCRDYIGESTRKEIEYAQSKGKKLRWFTHDSIGDKVVAMFTTQDGIGGRGTQNQTDTKDTAQNI